MSDGLTHHLYIDDSGQRDYAAPGKPYNFWLTQHFVFGGTLIQVGEARRLSAELAALKQSVFGTDQVEVKSSWLRRQEQREKKYLVPYGISEETLSRFTLDFYEAAGAAKLMFIASIVDKALMTERYGEGRWHTPAAAYEALVQRVQNELGRRGKAKVFIDELSGKTRAGNTYETNLRRHHKQLVTAGSRPLSLPITCLHSLPQFVKSHESQLVQVSDLVAYNVLRQVRDHGHKWESTVAQSDMYPWLRRILGKFRCSWWGRIQGYGVVAFPKP